MADLSHFWATFLFSSFFCTAFNVYPLSTPPRPHIHKSCVKGVFSPLQHRAICWLFLLWHLYLVLFVLGWTKSQLPSPLCACVCVFRQQHSHQKLPAEWHHPLSRGAPQLLPVRGIHDDPRMRTGRRLDGVSQDPVHQQSAGDSKTACIQKLRGKHLNCSFKES